MNTKINQNITFTNVENKNSINGGTCSVDNCSGWGTHYDSINLNGTVIFISFCKKHADDVKHILSTTMSQYPYFDGVCGEECCENSTTKAGIIEIDGLSVTVHVCDYHASQIGNVLLDGEEVIQIPTFKCIPRDDFENGMMFFCPYCQEFHKHGEGDGQRIAHCSRKDSPLIKTGYFIKLMQYNELLELKESIDSYLEFES